MQDQTPYLKRYTQGEYDIRVTSDVGRVCAQFYVEGKRTDVLTAPTQTALQAKIDRYLAGESSSKKIEALEASEEEMRKQIKKLEDALNKSGDSYAKCAQYEREIKTHEEEIEQLLKVNHQLQADVEQYRNDLAAYRDKAKPESTKTGTKAGKQ